MTDRRKSRLTSSPSPLGESSTSPASLPSLSSDAASVVATSAPKEWPTSSNCCPSCNASPPSRALQDAGEARGDAKPAASARCEEPSACITSACAEASCQASSAAPMAWAACSAVSTSAVLSPCPGRSAANTCSPARARFNAVADQTSTSPNMPCTSTTVGQVPALFPSLFPASPGLSAAGQCLSRMSPNGVP